MFGGKPLKFLLREFHIVSGLLCGQIPKAKVVDPKKYKVTMWEQLFGKDTFESKVQDVVSLLTATNLDDWKRLPLTLIVLVDGVVLCKTKELLVQSDHVEMMHDPPSSSNTNGEGFFSRIFLAVLALLNQLIRNLILSKPLCICIKQHTSCCSPYHYNS